MGDAALKMTFSVPWNKGAVHRLFAHCSSTTCPSTCELWPHKWDIPLNPPPFVILHSVLLLDITMLLQATCHKYKPGSCLQKSLKDGWLAWPPWCSSATPGGSATPLHPVLLPIAVRMRFGFCLLDFHAGVLVERWFIYLIFFWLGGDICLFFL